MKEAAGEANMTVITIVLIGVVAAVGIMLVPRLMNRTADRACCTDAGGRWSGNSCQTTSLYNASDYSSCVNEAKGTSSSSSSKKK